MDFSDFDNVKREKGNAMIRYRRLRKIANLFRLFEILLALIVFSWLSTQLPSVLHFTGKFFQQLSVVLVSPRFVFLIGNAIIITLFVKSGQFSSGSVSGIKEETHLYDEFVKNSDNRKKIYTPVEEIVFQDKQTVWEERSVPVTPRDSPPHSPRKSNKHRGSPPITPRSKQPELVLKGKSYRRSQSENIKREIDETPKRELRRSETEKCREVENSGKDPARKSVGEKEMSSEEFQRRIEAFIEKQAKFHLEESMAIVLQNQCC